MLAFWHQMYSLNYTHKSCTETLVILIWTFRKTSVITEMMYFCHFSLIWYVVWFVSWHHKHAIYSIWDTRLEGSEPRQKDLTGQSSNPTFLWLLISHFFSFCWYFLCYDIFLKDCYTYDYCLDVTISVMTSAGLQEELVFLSVLVFIHKHPTQY